MSDYEILKSRLKETPFLVANAATGDVQLANQTRAFRVLNEAGLFDSRVVMNAHQALLNFARLTGSTSRSFTLREITTIAGVPYSQSYNWMLEGVIEPSIRPRSGSGRGKDVMFSWGDAYVAGLFGSLRRQGVPLEILRKITSLLSEKSNKKKRTPRKESTSARP